MRFRDFSKPLVFYLPLGQRNEDTMGKKNREISAEITAAGKLPKEIEADLRDRGIAESDVLVSVRTDMNMACEFTPGWMIVTKTRLITATADPLAGEVHYFM